MALVSRAKRCPCDVCAERRLAAERVLEASGGVEAIRRQLGARSPRIADARRSLLEAAHEYGRVMEVPCLRLPVHR